MVKDSDEEMHKRLIDLLWENEQKCKKIRAEWRMNLPLETRLKRRYRFAVIDRDMPDPRNNLELRRAILWAWFWYIVDNDYIPKDEQMRLDVRIERGDYDGCDVFGDCVNQRCPIPAPI